MPILRTLLARAVAARVLDSRRRARKHRRLERRLSGAPRRIDYFHQVDDPYSHLAAQTLATLEAAYEIELTVHLVAPPAPEHAPERELLEAYARTDAARVAPWYRVRDVPEAGGETALRFEDPGARPDSDLVELAQRVAAAAIEGSAPVSERLVAIGAALWRGDRAALEALAEEGCAAESTTRERIAAGTERRRALGHYLGATFFDGVDWYWGIDRLGHLEQQLFEAGRLRSGLRAPLVHRPDLRSLLPASPGSAACAADQRLELFVSLRSPYSYLALERIGAFVRATGVELVLRPVLPMLMRGTPVPRAKGLYIVRDTKREADRLGLPFGRIADPIGRPVERGLSLFPWAEQHGKGLELLRSFARAAWAEGIDTGSDGGLRRVVERVGLSWDEARGIVDLESWREPIEENRRALYGHGLWGVPALVLSGPGEPDFAVWGQDRMWLVAAEIARRDALLDRRRAPQ